MKKIILYCLIMSCSWADGVSIVYNFRIAETSKRQVLGQKKEHPHIVTAVLVDQWRKTHNDIYQNITGAIGTYLRSLKSAYVKVDVGGGYIDQNRAIARTKKTRSQMDDILFSAGHGWKLTENASATVSGLLGVPTHKDTTFEGVQFGTGHVGLGIQLDSAWKYLDDKPSYLLAAFRCIHFVPRNVNIPTVTTHQKYSFYPGNIIDIILSHESGSLRNKFEFGYNPSFAFNATLKPSLPTINVSTTVIRSSFYANYKLLFLLGKNASGLGLGVSYGFDHRPKDIGFKKIITFWGAWGINF